MALSRKENDIILGWVKHYEIMGIYMTPRETLSKIIANAGEELKAINENYINVKVADIRPVALLDSNSEPHGHSDTNI